LITFDGVSPAPSSVFGWFATIGDEKAACGLEA
jgi:hypothetical protein